MRSLSLILLAIAAAPLGAQSTPATAAPQSSPAASVWRTRFDRANTPDSAMKVEAMPPGWHITTNQRGSGIAWRADQTGTGNFRVEAETFLFPSPGHSEGYGLVLGGLNLNADNQSYLYFLVRRDGQFLIKHRAGATTHDIVTWTANAAIARQEGTTNAKNTLAVEAGRDSVVFMVNNRRVHALSRANAPVTGLVGVRVNHGLSVHLTRLAILPR